VGFFSKLFGLAGQSQAQPSSNFSITMSADVGVRKYFALVESIRDCHAKREYDKMLDCCTRSLPLLGPLVRHCKREFGKFDVCSIPAIEVGCRHWGALNDIEALQSVAETIEPIPELREGWGGVVGAAYKDAAVATRIQDYLMKNPGAPQNKMGKYLGVPGKDTGRLIHTLTNLGRIVRIQSGKTYELHCVPQ
jgi:hypothetical protein